MTKWGPNNGVYCNRRLYLLASSQTTIFEYSINTNTVQADRNAAFIFH